MSLSADNYIKLKSSLTYHQDFPKPGVNFVDIQPIFADETLYDLVVADICMRFASEKIDMVVAIEARGFIIGSMVASDMELPLIMVRKEGKLPGNPLKFDTSSEYGKSKFEINIEPFLPQLSGGLVTKPRILIVDDILATGNTLLSVMENIDIFCEIVGVATIGMIYELEPQRADFDEFINKKNIINHRCLEL